MNISQRFRRKPADEFQIAVTAENRRQLAACRAAIARAKPFEALRDLAGFALEELDTACTKVEARL